MKPGITGFALGFGMVLAAYMPGRAVADPGAISGALAAVSPPLGDDPSSRDVYRDFFDLARHEREGIDFRVEARNLHSPLCVLAIHGGGIEPGSDPVARRIAAGDLSYYIFRATKPSRNVDLHVTSTHFNDPRAIDVAASARTCVSMHGFPDENRDVACVGGGNDAFRIWMADRLRAARFPIGVETPCTRWPGASPKNIVNRARERGVQIEMSSRLRDHLLANPRYLDDFSAAVRAAALSFPGHR